MRGGGIVHMPRGERVPIGTMAMWPTAAPPPAWLLCDGSSVAVDQYPDLYAVLGGTFGGGVVASAADSSGNGRNGTLIGTPGPQSVVSPWSGFGRAVQFPSSSTYIDCGVAGFSFAGPLTVEARVQYANLPSTAGSFASGIAGRYSGVNGGYVLYARSNGDLLHTPMGLRSALNKFVWGVEHQDGGETALISSTTIVVGTPYVVRGSIDINGIGRLYVNGVLEDSGFIGLPGTGGSATFRIGTLSFGGVIAANTIIDEVRVSNVERSSGASYPVDSAPFAPDANTVALYHLEDDAAFFSLPDLRGRFPLGKAASGTGSTLGGTGGSIDHTHSTDPSSFATGAAGAHNHGGATGAAGSHNHGGTTGNAGAHNHGGATGAAGSHNHGGTTGNAGAHDHGAATGADGAHDHGALTGARAATIDAHVGDTGLAGGHDHGAATGSAGAHAHTVDPASATTTSAGTHSHTTPATATGAPSATGNMLAGATAVGSGTHTHTLPAMATSSDGAHTHDVDIPSTATSSDGAHAHSVAAEADHDHDMGHGHTSPAHDHAIAAAAAHAHSIAAQADHAHTVATQADHTHTVASQADHAHTVATQADHTHTVASQADHTHTVDVPATSSSSANPPFLALNFIIKAVDE